MPRRPIGDVAMTGAERVRRYRLKRAVTKPVTKPADPDSATLAAKLAEAEARIAALEAELARERLKTADERKRRVGAEAKATKAAAALPETEAERVIARLKKQLAEKRAQLRHLTGWFRMTELPEKAGMSRSTYNKIVKALHPDAAPSEKDRAEGCQAFNVWVDNVKRRTQFKYPA